MQGLIGIIPFRYYYKQQAGSSFLRAEGLVNTTTDFKMWEHGHKYDSLIFQKVYWQEMMAHFNGPKILDLCDPDWINGTFDLIETGNLVDAVTCSSPALTELVKSYFPHKPVIHVPDRLNFNLFPPSKIGHLQKAKNVVWFGYITNAHETLPPFASVLKKLGLNLTIIADKPYSQEDEIFQLVSEFIHYNQNTAYATIQQADIALNPKSEMAFFKYKSNNKTIIAWKLGLPVAETPEDLERYLDPFARSKEVVEKMQLVNAEYEIYKSAMQYREIIENINSMTEQTPQSDNIKQITKTEFYEKR